MRKDKRGNFEILLLIKAAHCIAVFAPAGREHGDQDAITVIR